MQSAVSSERRRRPLLGPLWLQVLVAIARGAAMGSFSRWEHAFDAEHAAAVLNQIPRHAQPVSGARRASVRMVVLRSLRDRSHHQALVTVDHVGPAVSLPRTRPGSFSELRQPEGSRFGAFEHF